MPRAPRQCPATGCTERIVGRRYCEQHTRERQWTSASRPYGTPSRTGTTTWRRIRQQAIARDGNRCTQCGADGRHVPLVCDHIVPVSQGGHDTLANARMLCEACHRPKTQAEARAGRG